MSTMSYTTVSATNLGGRVGVADVDCQKQVRSWRLLRSLMVLLIPSCNCGLFLIEQNETNEETSTHNHRLPPRGWVSTTVITGTIFGYRRGKLNFCIQTDPKSTTPFLLLELAVPTSILAREMRSGILRVALECTAMEAHSETFSLLPMPEWIMYCNGRKVGFSVKRKASKADMEALKLMESVVVGAGTKTGKEVRWEGEIMYLRGNFGSVRRSSDSNSFHLIDPDENKIRQELSVFFLRARE